MTQEPHLTCTECGRTFETESLTAVDGELLCPDCLSATTVVCRECGERILRSENAGTDAHPLCAYCRDEDYTYCDHCGRLIHNSNAHYFDDDDDNTCSCTKPSPMQWAKATYRAILRRRSIYREGRSRRSKS